MRLDDDGYCTDEPKWVRRRFGSGILEDLEIAWQDLPVNAKFWILFIPLCLAAVGV